MKPKNLTELISRFIEDSDIRRDYVSGWNESSDGYDLPVKRYVLAQIDINRFEMEEILRQYKNESADE